jgi:plasmid stability protein
MASLLIRKLPDATKRALRQRAAANGRSMEEEARQILALELRKTPARSREGLGTALRRIIEQSGALGEFKIPARSEYPPTNYGQLFDDDGESK